MNEQQGQLVYLVQSCLLSLGPIVWQDSGDLYFHRLSWARAFTHRSWGIFSYSHPVVPPLPKLSGLRFDLTWTWASWIRAKECYYPWATSSVSTSTLLSAALPPNPMVQMDATDAVFALQLRNSELGEFTAFVTSSKQDHTLSRGLNKACLISHLQKQPENGPGEKLVSSLPLLAYPVNM